MVQSCLKCKTKSVFKAQGQQRIEASKHLCYVKTIQSDQVPCRIGSQVVSWKGRHISICLNDFLSSVWRTVTGAIVTVTSTWDFPAQTNS